MDGCRRETAGWTDLGKGPLEVRVSYRQPIKRPPAEWTLSCCWQLLWISYQTPPRTSDPCYVLGNNCEELSKREIRKGI